MFYIIEKIKTNSERVQLTSTMCVSAARRIPLCYSNVYFTPFICQEPCTKSLISHTEKRCIVQIQWWLVSFCSPWAGRQKLIQLTELHYHSRTIKNTSESLFHRVTCSLITLNTHTAVYFHSVPQTPPCCPRYSQGALFSCYLRRGADHSQVGPARSAEGAPREPFLHCGSIGSPVAPLDTEWDQREYIIMHYSGRVRGCDSHNQSHSLLSLSSTDKKCAKIYCQDNLSF